MRQPQEIKIKYKGKGYVVCAAQIAYACMYFTRHKPFYPFYDRLQSGRDWIWYHICYFRPPTRKYSWEAYEDFLQHLTRYAHLVKGLDELMLEAEMSCM